MPQLVDAYYSMVRKQNTIYDQMTRGVKTLSHNVYAQYTEIILQSRIFTSNVNREMAVIAVKASQDYENLRDAFNGQIVSNNNACASIATVLRERQDAENVVAE